MLPGFHPVEHLLLLLGRQGRKMLKALLQLLLLVRRKPLKLWIAFQGLFLVGWGQVLISLKPVSGVALLALPVFLMRLTLLFRSLSRLVLTGLILLGLDFLRKTGGSREHERQRTCRHHRSRHDSRAQFKSPKSVLRLLLRVCHHVVLYFQIIQQF